MAATNPPDDIVVLDYTNHRGERGLRRVRPIDIWFGSNEWHTTPQWIMSATDIDKVAVRYFALKDIHSWAPVGS